MGVNLILSDYNMPDMTGYDLLRVVKVRPNLYHTQFLMYLCAMYIYFESV